MSRVDGLSGSFWPDREQEALLRLAFAREGSVARRWQELQPLAVDRLEIGSLCLLPVVFHRLQAVGATEGPVARLKGAYQGVWYRNQLRLDRLAALVGALRSGGVDPLVIGGAPLAALHFPQPGLRPIAQLDVAVVPAEWGLTRRTFEQLGWRPAGELPGGARYVSSDGAADVLLHRGAPAFLAGPLSPGDALERLGERSGDRLIGECAMRVLDAAAEVLVACGLGARRVLPQSPQWLVDSHQLLGTGAVDPDDLAALAAAFRLLPAVRDTAAYLTKTSETIDAEPLRVAVAARPLPRRDLLVHALAGAGPGRFGEPPTALVAHARATIGQPLPRAVAGLPGVFQSAWGVARLRDFPAAAAHRSAGRLRRAVRAGGRGGRQPDVVDSRNRSASS